MSYLGLKMKEGETVRIGDTISVRFSKVDSGHVHVCVEAPREVPIWRDGAKRKDQGVNK